MDTYMIITGNLIARTAVHVGSGAGNYLTDALIRRNGAGQPIIPGTAIAGVLRALASRLYPSLSGEKECQAFSPQKKKRNLEPCTCRVCQLFGNLNPSDTEQNSASASWVLIFDAVLKDSFMTTIRDGVGIDRSNGTAAATAKFDLETLPPNSVFEFRLELRKGNDIDVATDEMILAAILAEWQAGRAWIGGRRSRGFGGFCLKDIQVFTPNLHEPKQLVAFLRSDKPWQEQAIPENPGWLDAHIQISKIPEKDQGVPTYSWISVEFTLQADGPLIPHDTQTAGIIGFDHAPLLLNCKDWAHPVLPGSSLRGVLRSHAERIARTLTTKQAKDKTDFLEKCSACDPLASRRQRENNEPVALESCDSLLRYLAPDEKQQIEDSGDIPDRHLCLACRLFGTSKLGSRLIVEDAPFAGERPQYKILDFLAVDRFTGGGADGAKFDALVLWNPCFKVRIYLEEPQAWELGWLALTLRDLRDGWLRVGMGAAKGFGRVTIPNDWNLQIGFIGKNPFGLPASKTSGVFQVAEYTEEQQATWLAQAKTWVEAFTTKLNEVHTVRPLYDLPDPYFDHLQSLYSPEEVTL